MEYIFIIINILYTNFYNLLLLKSPWLIKLYLVQTFVLSGKKVGTHFPCRNNLFFSQFVPKNEHENANIWRLCFNFDYKMQFFAFWSEKLALNWPNMKNHYFNKNALSIANNTLLLSLQGASFSQLSVRNLFDLCLCKIFSQFRGPKFLAQFWIKRPFFAFEGKNEPENA